MSRPDALEGPKKGPRLLLWVSLALALASGCGGSSSGPRGTEEADASVADAGVRSDAQVPRSDGSEPVATDAGPDADVGPGMTLDVVDPGQMPRRQLRAAQGAPTTWIVTSSARHTSTLGGDEQAEFADVNYTVAVSFRGIGDSLQVLLNPTIEQFQASYDTDIEASPPGVTVQRFNALGRLLGQERYDGRIVSRPVLDAATLDALTLPNAILEVPEAAVGVGARWGADLKDDSIALRVQTEITNLSDTELETRRTINLLDGRDRTESVDATITATYDPRSLVMRRASIEMRSTFRGTLAVNGTPQEVTMTIEQSRTVREVTP